MYWTDAQRGVIETSALDGSGRAVLIDERRSTLSSSNNNKSATVRPHYYGVALDQRYIYYTDWSRGYDGRYSQQQTARDKTTEKIMTDISKNE